MIGIYGHLVSKSDGICRLDSVFPASVQLVLDESSLSRTCWIYKKKICYFVETFCSFEFFLKKFLIVVKWHTKFIFTVFKRVVSAVIRNRWIVLCSHHCHSSPELLFIKLLSNTNSPFPSTPAHGNHHSNLSL